MGQSKKHTLKARNLRRRRSDLLRRHLTLHDASAPSDSKRVRACDACHASKIRCDGGARCSLCKKRGINCAFTRAPGPSLASDIRQGTASSSLHSSRGSRSPDGPRSSTGTSVSSSGSRSGMNQVVLPMSFINSTVVRQEPLPQQDPSSASLEGLQLVLEAVSRPKSTSSSRPQRQPPPEVKNWSAACIDAYFGRFHDRWPVLHAPTFEKEVQSARLRSTVLLIGSWLRHENEGNNHLIFDIHSLLVKRLLDEMVRLMCSRVRGIRGADLLVFAD